MSLGWVSTSLPTMHWRWWGAHPGCPTAMHYGLGLEARPTHAPLSSQAIVAQQDTLLELRLQEGLERRERLSRAGSQAGEGMAPGPRAPERGSTELGLLQRQHTLVQEELARCRQLCQDKVQEVGLLETRLRDSEQSRLRLERELEQARRQLDGARRVPDPRRRSLPAGDALYLSFTPPQVLCLPR